MTAENVAANYHISREEMDKFGLESNRRRMRQSNQENSRKRLFPLWPINTNLKNGKRVRDKFVFDADDGVRWPTKLEDMAKLKSPFKEGGNVTAANSRR